MQAWFLKQWQQFGVMQIVLHPLAWLFAGVTWVRRCLYALRLLKQHKLAVPVIVVGNISVGGTGKTPLVIYLVEQLRHAGYAPGVISRGYGGTQTGAVTSESDPLLYGDEPVLIAKRTGVPVWVNPDRVQAGQGLLNANPSCDVILSDDGLQHYRLHRDIEIIVVNARHSLGNQQLLPAGPLREPIRRFSQVNAIVNTCKSPLPDTVCVHTLPPVFSMQLNMQGVYQLNGTQKISLQDLKSKPVVAIAGIGHPERFFNFIKGLGLQCDYHAFKDHHAFTQADFEPFASKTILMTEKDAVKCKALALSDAWYLPVSAMLAPTGNQTLPQLLQSILQQSQD